MAEQNSKSAAPPPSPVTAAFERKIRLGKWSLLFERLWPRLWVLIGLAALFLILSLTGFWTYVGDVAHRAGLVAFALAAVAGVAFAARVQTPSREEAIRRIEARSGVPHRPASSYEDTLSAPGGDPATLLLWTAHRARLARLLDRLKVGRPEPRADRFDPLALRTLLMLMVALLALLAGDNLHDRLASAFRLGPSIRVADARLDAWVTPPAYTARPPLLLADGAHGGTIKPASDGKPIEIPDRSQLIVRSSGAGIKDISLEVVGGARSATKANDGKLASGSASASSSDAAEARLELRASGVVKVVSGSTELARWAFTVVPDLPPKIFLSKDPERTMRGSMKLTYKMQDDYGIATAEARFERVKPAPDDPRTAWARETTTLKGPRPPLERLPVLQLRIPRTTTKEAEASSHHDTGSHLWAGSKVRMTLVARDHAGNIGRSEPLTMQLPQRRFTKLIAKAVVEQRRKLVEDPRWRGHVLKSIDALTVEPDGYFTDRVAYLGLRDAYHRLARDKSRAGLRSVIDQLWHVALRLEDGGSLSAAEQRLRDAQEQLSKALENGASDEEIQRLMQELRQALAEFMQQMQKQAENQPPMDMQGMNPNQILRQEDLNRMLNNLENMARQGSRDQAQDMLSQLRDMLEMLQSGRMAQGQQGQANQQAMQMMNEFGDIIGQQQRLQDETYGEQGQQEGQQGQDGQGQGQQGQQGQRGQQGQGQRGRGQQGQQGQGRQGQQGQPDPNGQGGQGGAGRMGELGQRQGQLRERLGRLQRGMQQNGMQTPGQLDGAQQSMENAERALREGDLGTAAREQGKALEQLRQGAQSMAQQMMRNMPSQFGQGPAGDAPLDPLGRPQRSEGPDLGTSVKVPDEIEMQTAREILEELRRRLGEQVRPTLELDYIERLLRRF